MIPAVIDAPGKRDIDEGAPLRPLRFLQELHPCLMWESIPFAGVAGNAGANDILPCCLSSAVAGQYVIDIQIVTLEVFTAILACVHIALKDVESREFYFFFW